MTNQHCCACSNCKTGCQCIVRIILQHNYAHEKAASLGHVNGMMPWGGWGSRTFAHGTQTIQARLGDGCSRIPVQGACHTQTFASHTAHYARVHGTARRRQPHQLWLLTLCLPCVQLYSAAPANIYLHSTCKHRFAQHLQAEVCTVQHGTCKHRFAQHLQPQIRRAPANRDLCGIVLRSAAWLTYAALRSLAARRCQPEPWETAPASDIAIRSCGSGTQLSSVLHCSRKPGERSTQPRNSKNCACQVPMGAETGS